MSLLDVIIAWVLLIEMTCGLFAIAHDMLDVVNVLLH